MPLSLRFVFALLLTTTTLLATGCKSAVNQHIYVSCRNGKAVQVYDLDPKTGTLALVETVELEGAGGPLALSPDEQTLYVTLNGPARVAAYNRDPKAGTLTLIGNTPVPAHPTYLDIDATGKFALTASYGEGQVNSYRVAEDRLLVQGPIQTINTERTAHASLIDPTNQYLFIPHTTPNAIYQFKFNELSGRLTPNQPIITSGGGTADNPEGPRHYAYHPTLPAVYVVNELDSSVSAYQFDRRKGTLQRFQSLTTLPGNFTERNTCADIHVTPNGRFVYASNRGHDSIAAYAINPSTGMMRFVGRYQTEAVPREFEIDLTGQYLFSAGMRSNKLAAYAINQDTGELTRIGTYDTPQTPLWVTAARKR